MRLFVAIGLPDVVRAALSRLQSDLRVGRLVEPDNLHLTLAFLDEQDLPTAEAVNELLGDIRAPAFDLRIAGLDVFDRARPRLVFAASDRPEALVSLRKKVRVAVRDAGVDLPRERFRPHVTLARLNRALPQFELDKLGAFLESHGDFSLDPFRTDRFGLYRSTLGPDGPEYDLLAEYMLDDPAARP
ncbi:2'-5' RNA ligase [Roseobacter sp. AzwK-3b]|uniref:RNA 2',3'-cyclic phosphodiesterase n=1 Tax=Roseobacter sp. AzwK-3b TaxID=351016 RepID=UPI000156A602|nr:RNA 2',3'-cyclic phosphodiesterase [Roseobacter sp. AzwK-3b]EDM70350.1 2'-5' RNA ligase [Roseobacter sp. AzwK-3b]